MCNEHPLYTCIHFCYVVCFYWVCSFGPCKLSLFLYNIYRCIGTRTVLFMLALFLVFFASCYTYAVLPNGGPVGIYNRITMWTCRSSLLLYTRHNACTCSFVCGDIPGIVGRERSQRPRGPISLAPYFSEV